MNGKVPVYPGKLIGILHCRTQVQFRSKVIEPVSKLVGSYVAKICSLVEREQTVAFLVEFVIFSKKIM